MLYIYKYTNKINGKIYIGQTNNIQKRQNGHKSAANNIKNHSYADAFHSAIRKYGYENFSFEVLEEASDEKGRDYLNDREKYYIQYYHSLCSENGYNITSGGDGCAKPRLTFEEKCACSKLFSEKEVRDIQSMLVEGYQYFEIQAKYPTLTDSFLTNINTGLNFKREDLSYPLLRLHSRFSKETIEEIRLALKSQIPYNIIQQQYGISIGYLSQINNGTRWKDESLTYPLAKKICADKSYVEPLFYDLLFTNLTAEKLGQKYNKAKSTITAINTGRNHHNSNYLYPLRQHLEENQKIWNSLDNTVSTIPGQTGSKATY